MWKCILLKHMVKTRNWTSGGFYTFKHLGEPGGEISPSIRGGECLVSKGEGIIPPLNRCVGIHRLKPQCDNVMTICCSVIIM